MTHVFIATPAFGGQCSVDYAKSLVGLTVALLVHERVGVTYHAVSNESLIQRARNNCVKAFLESDATHLLFIDADLSFDHERIVEMLKAKKDLIAGYYPCKRINWAAIREAAKNDEPDLPRAGAILPLNVIEGAVVDENGIVPVADAPTGLMLITRECLTRMIEAYPETRYKDDEDKDLHAIFDCFVDNGRYLSEDFAFCRRWQRIGGVVWLYTKAVCEHTGYYVFRA